jgi:O-antigen/teichoic acid export membrane protein/O-antigen ligase
MGAALADTAPVTRLRRHYQAALPGLRFSAVSGTIGGRLAAAVLSFAAGVITARALGPHGRALLAIAIAVPAIFGVACVFGMDNANARFAGRSHSAFRQSVRRSVLFSAIAGSALAVAWLAAGLRWPGLRFGLDPRLAALSAALCPVSLLLTLLGTAEIGRGRIGVYNVVMVSTTTVYLAGITALLLAGHLTVAGCFLACAAGQLLGVAALLILTRARVHPDGEQVALRRYGSYALRAYLPNMAQYGMLRMDVPIIQALAGISAVALYAVALPVAEGVMLLPTAIALVIFPQVTSGVVGQAAARRIGYAVLAASVLLAGAVAAAAPVLVPAIYGAPFRGSVAVIWWMLPGMVAFSAGRTPQAFLAATDRLNVNIVATVTGLMAGLAGLVWLAPRFGAVGAGAADSLGYAAFAAVVLPYAVRGVAGRRTGWPLSLSRAWSWARQGALARCQARGPALLTGCAALAAGMAAALVSTRTGQLQLAMLAVLALLVVLIIPGAGLIALAIACPLSQTSAGAAFISVKDLLVLMAATAIGQLASGRLARPRAVPAALTVAVIGYLLLSATLAGGGPNPGQDWRYVLMLGLPLLLLPLIAGPGAETRRALVVFGFSAAFLAVPEAVRSHSALATAPASPATASAVTAADNTGAVNHNAEGAIFVLALAVLLAALPRCRSAIGRLAFAAAIAALAIGIAYSFSRSAYLGALAVVILYAARRSIRGLAGMAVAVGCLLPILPSAVSARLATLWASSGLDVSSALRVDLWHSALRMFAAHPVFGVGYLNFAVQLPGYFVATGSYNPALIQFSQLDYAHNTYLTILAETGLAGAAGIAALVVLGWRRARAAGRAGDWAGEAALLGLAGMGICSLFGEVLLVAPILVAFLLVLAAPRPGLDQPSRPDLPATPPAPDV